MPERRRTWRILRRSSPGFTLVEVVAALALLTVLSVVGVSAVQIAIHGLARSLEEARWNTTVLLFDRIVRRGIDELPSAFWAPHPKVRREGDDVFIVDGSKSGCEVMRFSLRGGILSVATRAATVPFHDITAVSVETVRASDGREGGIRIELVTQSQRQSFLVAWKGQRL